MGDELIDDVLKSLQGTGTAWNNRPVVEKLVNRMREFGYEDEHIRTVLIPGG